MRRIIMLILVLILTLSGVSSNTYTSHESKCEEIRMAPGLFGEELISKLKEAGCWCQ